MDERIVGQYWDRNAGAWTEGVRSGHDVYRQYVNNPAFFEILPELKNKAVLDVGCGEGYNTRLFAELGANVTGVDISEKMIEAARACDGNAGIQYHVASGSGLTMFDDASFDVVLSTMAMMDMPCYDECIAEVARVIKPGGVFQFSITHPCSMTRAWKWLGDESNPKQYMRIANYFSLHENEDNEEVSEWYFSGFQPAVTQQVTKFRVPDFYRTLSEYFNTLVRCGFIVTQLQEPVADEADAAKIPAIAETRNIPYSLIFQCRRSDG